MQKQQNLILSTAFADGGLGKYARRVETCLPWLKFLECIADVTHPKKLKSAYFCHVRLCPCCMKRRSFKSGEIMLRIAKETLDRHPTTKFLFLTLTVPNVRIENLRDALTHITKSWDKLIRRKRVKTAVKGYHRAIEITYNSEEDTYHPHMHIILAVNSRYFKSDDYINQKEWLKMWQESTKQPEIKILDIRKIKVSGEDSFRLAYAITEACKYSIKTFNFERHKKGKQRGKIINLEHRKLYKKLLENKVFVDYGFPNHAYIRVTREETATTVEGLSKAIHGKKFTHYGGLFQEIKTQLALEDGEETKDLLHVDESLDSEDTSCNCPQCDSKRKLSLFKYHEQIGGFPVREYLRGQGS